MAAAGNDTDPLSRRTPQMMAEAEARDGDHKQVDFYVGRTRHDAGGSHNGSSSGTDGAMGERHAAGAPAPSSTSFMFCPQVRFCSFPLPSLHPFLFFPFTCHSPIA